ncbi:hypothetical protein KBY82_14340 [Cyanobium sp. AMD-g]|uniref:hypothetical protein n=1 Tax=Cyanobium sp. AMD-g TaxID=2823699 RepID=UPI0020CCA9D2|nr:hypothetical protein [Cyanobium sp. AMD-g]MCP9931958.1 hypothetical protein [Cyanobium sp. AMD-g]
MQPATAAPIELTLNGTIHPSVPPPARTLSGCNRATDVRQSSWFGQSQLSGSLSTASTASPRPTWSGTGFSTALVAAYDLILSANKAIGDAVRLKPTTYIAHNNYYQGGLIKTPTQ